MPADLYFSNSFPLLLEKLRHQLRHDDPFNPPLIATPNPPVRKWVQMRLADALGVVAGFDFVLLERLLWKRLTELDLFREDPSRLPAEMLSEEGLELLILAKLRRDPPAAVKRYLAGDGFGGTGMAGNGSSGTGSGGSDSARNGADGTGLAATGSAGKDAASSLFQDFEDEAIRARRLAQLAKKLASLFREYEYSRVAEHGHQGLVELWSEGRPCFLPLLKGEDGGRLARAERNEKWQSEIYHDIFKLDGIRDRLGAANGQYQYTLPQYAHMVLSQDRGRGRKPSPPPQYHLFGLSQISSFHRSLIRELSGSGRLRGEEAHFHIYALNPCQAYWEDVLSPRETARLSKPPRQAERASRALRDAAGAGPSRGMADAPQTARETPLSLFEAGAGSAWRTLETRHKEWLRLPDAVMVDEELHLETGANALLRRFGKVGRENVQLWNQITDYDFHDCFAAPEPRTVLAALQKAVLLGWGKRAEGPEADAETPDGIGDHRPDSSLTVLAAPEIHRELETARDLLLRLFLEDPTLRPDEVAVAVPDVSKYRAPFESVFGAYGPDEPGHIPFNILDTDAGAESEFARGVKTLFGLVSGRFARREVLSLLRNGCFMRRHGLTPDRVETFTRWAEDLRVFHGFDAGHKARLGYAEDDFHTWSLALERLLLGLAMEGPEDGEERDFAGIVPHGGGEADGGKALGEFASILGALRSEAEGLEHPPRRGWGEWLDAVERFCYRHLCVTEDRPLEREVEEAFRAHLKLLRGMDAVEALFPCAPGGGDGIDGGGGGGGAGAAEGGGGGAGAAEGGGAGCNLPVALHLIENALQKLPATRGQFLTGGITFACLQTLRSIPFRVVFLLGLGEGQFPDEGRLDPMDLRGYRRLIGDVDAAMRGRYAFLETLLATRDRVYLSYIDRDIQQDKKHQMCSCLEELKDYLESDLLAPGRRFEPVAIPLLGRDPRLFSARAEEPFALRGFDEGERLLSFLETVKERGLDPFQAPVSLPKARIRPAFPPLPAREREAGRIVLTLRDLARYLENPVQYTCEREWGFPAFDGLDDLLSDDEPLALGRRFEDRLLQRACLGFLLREAGPSSLLRAEEDLGRAYRHLAKEGQAPHGLYQEVDRGRLLDKARSCFETLAELREEWGREAPLHFLPEVVLGRADLRRPSPAGGDPLRHLKVTAPILSPVEGAGPGNAPENGGEVEIQGSAPWLFLPRDGEDGPGGRAITALVVSGGRFKARLLLRPFLFYMASLLAEGSAARIFAARPFQVVCVHFGGRGFTRLLWPSFLHSRVEALAYFRGLLPRIMEGRDFDHLPLEAVHRRFAAASALNLGAGCKQALEEALAADRGDLRLPDYLRLVMPEVPGDAAAKIRARFSLLYPGLEEAPPVFAAEEEG